MIFEQGANDVARGRTLNKIRRVDLTCVPNIRDDNSIFVKQVLLSEITELFANCLTEPGGWFSQGGGMEREEIEKKVGDV